MCIFFLFRICRLVILMLFFSWLGIRVKHLIISSRARKQGDMRCMFTKLRHEQQKHQTVKRNKVYRDCRDSCKEKEIWQKISLTSRFQLDSKSFEHVPPRKHDGFRFWKWIKTWKIIIKHSIFVVYTNCHLYKDRLL